MFISRKRYNELLDLISRKTKEILRLDEELRIYKYGRSGIRGLTYSSFKRSAGGTTN